MEAEQVQAPNDELERLRAEVAELRASRARLVAAADAACMRIERDLHEGAQQHLIALSVKLQLAGPLVDADAAATKALLGEMERDVQEALDDAARLAQRIYPQLAEPGGLAAALRAAAVSAGIPASVDVAADSTYTPEIGRTVFLCWLEALEEAEADGRATATVREEDGLLTFEVVEPRARSGVAAVESSARLDELRDRVEALGGRLTIDADGDRGTRISGSLPLSSRASRSPRDRGSRP